MGPGGAHWVVVSVGDMLPHDDFRHHLNYMMRVFVNPYAIIDIINLLGENAG